jgi:signal transduction histidine kinase
MTLYLDGGRDPGALASTTLGMRYFRPARFPEAGLPEELLRVPPDTHQRMSIGGFPYYVVVREIAPADRVYLAYSLEPFIARERWLSGVLGAGILVTGALAWLAGRAAMRPALAPLDSVVNRIRGLDPEQSGHRVSLRPEDGELGVIVEALNHYVETLDRVLARERAFAAAAAHELRTPLTVIQGSAELLTEVDGIPVGPLSRIQMAVTEASCELDALLALSTSRSLGASRLIELGPMMRGLTTPYELIAWQQNTRFEWDDRGPAWIASPAGVLGAIYTNVLRNAIRAAPDGTVKIVITPGRIEVLDSGKGFPPELLPVAFQPSTRSREHGGSGLGLYIAHVLAGRCGWGFAVGNRPEGGASAVLTFPAATPEMEGVAA